MDRIPTSLTPCLFSSWNGTSVSIFSLSVLGLKYGKGVGSQETWVYDIISSETQPTQSVSPRLHTLLRQESLKQGNVSEIKKYDFMTFDVCTVK